MRFLLIQIAFVNLHPIYQYLDFYSTKTKRTQFCISTPVAYSLQIHYLMRDQNQIYKLVLYLGYPLYSNFPLRIPEDGQQKPFLWGTIPIQDSSYKQLYQSSLV